ncbi:MAG: hypothetical protein ABSF00_09715 [Candidatus Bathyarchaeia archaeon]|jgi:hypothetical protein
MGFLKLNRIIGAVSVGIMSGLALTAVMISNFALHSQLVVLNIYSNGSSDWTMDATILLKSLFGLMFVAFTLGLALGLLATRKK